MLNSIKKYFANMEGGFKRVLLFFLIWLVMLNIISYIAHVYVVNNNHENNSQENKSDTNVVLIEQWFRWDARFFYDVANNGYKEPSYGHFNIPVRTAWFPLYPFIIRHLGLFIGDLFLSQRLIVVFSTLFLMIFMYKLFRMDYDEKISQNAVLLFLLFPSSFFLIAGYSESIFILFLVLSFYFSRKSNSGLIAKNGCFLNLNVI